MTTPLTHTGDAAVSCQPALPQHLRVVAVMFLLLTAFMHAGCSSGARPLVVNHERELNATTDRTLMRATHFLTGTVGDMVLKDGHLFISNSWSRGDGMMVLDVTNPAQPRFVHSQAAKGYVSSSVIKDNYLYTSSWFSLIVMDITKPEETSLIRDMLLNFPAADIAQLAIDGDRLFLAGRKDGLRIFDISQPASPVLLDYLPEPAAIAQVAVKNNLIVIRPLKGDSTIARINADHKLITQSTLSLSGDVYLSGRLLYESAKDGIKVYDVSDPANPVATASLPGLSIVTQGKGQILALNADHELVILDNAQPVRSITLPADATIAISYWQGSLFYFTDKHLQSLRILDISQNTAVELSATPVMRDSGHMQIDDQGNAILSYVHSGKLFVQTLDQSLLAPEMIRKTAYPRKTRHATFTGHVTQQLTSQKSDYFLHGLHRASRTYRMGNYMLAGDGVVDISNVKHPRIVVPASRSAAAISVSQGIACLAENDQLALLDVSALPDIKKLGIYPSPDKATKILGVTSKAGRAYVIELSKETCQLRTLDISDPLNPRPLSVIEIPPSLALTVHGKYLYIAGMSSLGRSILTLVDITNSDKPVIAKKYEDLLEGSSYHIAVHDNQLFFVDSSAGIKVASLADPLNLSIRHVYTGVNDQTPSYTDFVIRDGYLYGLRFSQIDRWSLED